MFIFLQTNMKQETITLKAEELLSLLNFVDEMPTKYGHPIKTFFLSVQAKRDEETQINKDVQEGLYNSQGQTPENIGSVK
jgi:hypothetical protein